MARKKHILKKISTRQWALGVSIGLHVVLLSVFAVMRFVQPVERAKMVVAANVTFAEQQPPPEPEQPIVPKPKIEPKPPTPKKEVVQQPKPIEPDPKPEPKPVVQKELPKPTPPPQKAVVDFFDSKYQAMRVCYVVDCSGSMYGFMGQVRKQLKESIGGLDSQQSFCVVFFRDGQELVMTGDGRLQNATAKAKIAVFEQIETIRPKGQVDAWNALKSGMAVRDRYRRQPDVIYFLTDGFDMGLQGGEAFEESAKKTLKSLAPNTIIHTIGIWPQPEDRAILKKLAEVGGGRYTELQ